MSRAQKSFQDILDEKMQRYAGADENSSKKQDFENSNGMSDTWNAWRERLDFKPYFRSHLDQLKNYTSQNFSKTETEERSSTISEEMTQASKKASAPKKTETACWSFSQQLAIEQLIRLGADLHLRSPAQDVKRAYKKLVCDFHPDRHLHTDVVTKKRLEGKLTAAVEAYRLFEEELRQTAA